MHKDRNYKKQAYGELSAVWQELLGGQTGESVESEPSVSSEAEGEPASVIPTIESDPWSTLVHAKGVEMVDLEQLHLHMSEQDVEQVLEIMQEQPAKDAQKKADQAGDH